jgi:hypothetical protein
MTFFRPRKFGSLLSLEKRVMLDASLPAISGQVLWLDAKDGTTILDADGDNAATGTGGAGDGFAGTVATWKDKSGYLNNVTQSTAANRPTYNASTLNGNPVLGFDGLNDALFRPDTSASLDVTNNGLTVIAVTRAANAAGSPMIINKENSYEVAIQGSKIQGAIETSAAGGWVWGGTTAIDTAWHMTGFQHADTVWNFFKDANLTQTIAAGNGQVGNISNTTGNFNVGARGVATPTSQFFGGSMAEILIYNRALTSDEMQDVENYLATKWGFAITDTAPVVSTNAGRTLDEGTASIITNAHLATTDADNSESILKYTLSSAATHGTLTNTNTGLTLGLGDTFTQADIDSNYITYTHDGTYNFSDAFSFTVTDGYATTAATTFSLNIVHTKALSNISGQVLWLDASDAASILDADGDNAATGTGGANDGFSGSVSTWEDKSSSNFDVTAAGAAERPTYSLGTLNGLNTVTFDGGTDRLTNMLASIPGDDFSTFIVFNRTTTVGRDAVFEMGQNPDRNGWFINEANNGKINYYLNGSFYNYTSSYVAGQYSLVSTVHNTNTINLYRDATNEVSTAGGVRTATTGIFVGDDSTSGDQLQGNIAEIIVYDRDLTADERHDVETYLAAKWGLSLIDATPTISANAGITLNEGASSTITNASLSATDADNSESLLTYILTSTTTYGTIANTNTGLTLGLGDTFTQSDIDNGYITYTHDDTENYTDSFEFAVTDFVKTSSSATFNITINAVNDAPTFSTWTTASSENFEGGAAGWNDNTTENGGTIYTSFLGRHSLDGGVQSVYKTYALSGTEEYVTISFDLYEIDSWDGENFSIYVDDVAILTTSLHQSTFNSPADGTSGAVSWTIQETTPFNANFAFGAWTDQRYHVNLTVATTAASVKLGFGSTLNQATNDEAWGIDNIIVSEVGGNGTSGPFIVSEKSTNGDAFGIISATDPDTGDTLTYTITGGTGFGIFALNPATGVLTVSNAAALDYETTPSYTLDILVTDSGGLTDTATVTVNVLDVPENTAPVINALGPLSVAENAAINTVAGTVTSTDAESNTVTYSITAGNTDNLFAINPTTGAIRLSSVTNLNYEWDNSYTLTIQATDNGFGPLSSTRNVVINITDINEAPTFDPVQSVLDDNLSVRYSAATGNFYKLVTTTANLTTATTNAAAMSLNGVAGYLATSTSAAENAFLSGLITTATWLGGSDSAVEGEWLWNGGAEAGQMFWLGAAAGSAQNGFYTNWNAGEPNNSGGIEDGIQLLTSGKWNDINVATALPYLVEWDGTAVLASLQNGPYTLTENSAGGTSVGFAHAGDPDAGDTQTYSITGGTGAAHFAIDAATGEITLTNPAAANYELATSYTLDLLVEDTGGLTDTVTVTINIADANDTPTALDLSGTFVTENSSNGTLVGLLSTTDEDVADTHIYTLLSNPGNKFTIVGNQLQVAGNIDYEQTQHISLTIRTDDGNGGTYDRVFNIQIGDQADTFTPPPGTGFPNTGSGNSLPLPQGDTSFSHGESLIHSALRGGEEDQISAFYGLGKFTQVLRDFMTFPLRRSAGAVQDGSLQAHSLEEDIDIAKNSASPELPQGLMSDHYTNLREALEFLSHLAETRTDTSPEVLSDAQEPPLSGPEPFNPLQRQFVDVLTYHEQRQAHLRKALLEG